MLLFIYVFLSLGKRINSEANKGSCYHLLISITIERRSQLMLLVTDLVGKKVGEQQFKRNELIFRIPSKWQNVVPVTHKNEETHRKVLLCYFYKCFEPFSFSVQTPFPEERPRRVKKSRSRRNLRNLFTLHGAMRSSRPLKWRGLFKFTHRQIWS